MGEVFIQLAKAAIAVSLGIEDNFDLAQARSHYPQLNQQGAVFVTLTQAPNEQLRGCIGSLTAYRPLYKDIIANAQAAALSDPRFKPLSIQEFNKIHIEVSLLSAAKPIEYRDIEDLKNQIKPQIDGVILQLGKHHATYLPSVWEQLPTFETFFASLCLKANLSKACLKEHPSIQTYQATKYKEK
ncbi:MAG: AmmeMemoRadiSam system protein A [Campylobacterota bacterium]|nr:AmmeMemoRadiSam system protein A [Campylobacterota bacterium]